jgi:cytochrome c peroxidase
MARLLAIVTVFVLIAVAVNFAFKKEGSADSPVVPPIADDAGPEIIPARRTATEAPVAPATSGSDEIQTIDNDSIEAPAMSIAVEDVGEDEILLGTNELTAGIPGDGPLTVDEIRAWLDDPRNHMVLKPTLPKGLAAGAGQIAGIDENPLTRAKIELGRQIYFDTRISVDNTISCASCHDPANGYAKDTQFGVGVGGQLGGRNSPVAYNRILSAAQFWDGRAASLEDQAIGPMANPIEMGNTHEVVVNTLGGLESYRIQFEKIFADGMTIENAGRALASFERAIVTGPTPWDYYVELRDFEQAYAADLEDLEILKEDDPEFYDEYMALKQGAEANPLNESAQRGGELFFGDKAGCTQCHVGANFADELYHNLGVGMAAAEPDIGRMEVTRDEKDRGAFKTPTVRNITQTAPYMHDGSVATLAEVVELYNKGGEPNANLSDKIKPLKLTDQEKADLVAFMEALTGEFPAVETGRLPPNN